MRKIKKIFSPALLFLLMLSSCTLEKRIYMPGYHTERKINRIADKCNIAENTNNIVTSHVDVSALPTTEPTEIYNEINDQNYSVSTAVVIPTLSLKNKPTWFVQDNEAERSQINVGVKNKKSRIVLKKKSNHAYTDGAGKGLFMIILALALVAMGYLFFTLLGVFGLILFLIFGIGGAILFIIGLILAIIGLL